MRNLHSEITARILTALRAGTVPWRQPWAAQASGAMPRNAITGRPYSGANVILCWITAQERGYTSPAWLTFKQATEAGGSVRKGEKGTTVIYVSSFMKKNDEGETRAVPFLKAFTIFNVCQCEGLPDKLSGNARPKARNPHDRDPVADQFVAATGATISEGSEGRAYYRRSTDHITMPSFASFNSADTFYSTLFHELTHWTGHTSRLNREMGKRFGDASYAAEELVAELGAAFLSAEFQFNTEEASAAYIANWIKVLENNERLFVAAASAGSKAVEFMRGLAVADETLTIEQKHDAESILEDVMLAVDETFATGRVPQRIYTAV
jgi:antirestriction protein ArdC